MAAVQYFIERFSVTCNKPVSHLQLACCPSHCAVPWQDKGIRIYENNNLEPPLELIGHHGDVSAMVFGTLRDRLVLCSASEDYVIVWDIDRCYRQIKEGVIASGRVVGTLLGKVEHLSLCPLSAKLTACSGSRVFLLNAEREDVLGVLKAHLGPVTASDCVRLFLRVLSAIVVILDFCLRNIIFELIIPSFLSVNFLFLCLGNGKQIACGLGDGSVLLYNSSLTSNPAVYTGHSKAVNTVCWSHSKRWFLSTSEDPTLCIWTANASEPVLTMGDDQFAKPIRSAQFYYLDKFLLLASGSNLLLYLYHLDTTRDDIKRYKQRSKSKLTSKFNMKSGTDITSMSAINDFYSYIVLAAGADRTIQVFDMNQGCVATQIPDAHSRAVHHLTQNKGSPFCTQALESYSLFLSSAITDGLKLWDLRTARCVRRYESHVNRCHHCTAAFSPCGRFIATGSEDHSTYIYDTRSSNFLHKLPRHTETVLNVAFNPAKPEFQMFLSL
uniref:Uncharacterized protein n=1 Tax=Sinocyclocheilus rhinocerous TaxID=307959 RepID=A0A673KD09_9TELE